MSENTIRPGERLTYQCNSCMREYALVYEPKLEGDRNAAKMAEPAPVKHFYACPFCGDEDTECLDGDE